MCNLYSETKGHAAIRALVRTAHDGTGSRRSPVSPRVRSRRSCAIARMVSANWSWRAGACRDHCSLAASRSPTSATSQARTGAAGFRRGAAASCQRHRPANMPTRSRARRRPGLRSAKTGRCSPSRASGGGGGACEGRRARRSRATTTEEFDLWLEGETVEGLKLQRPLPDGMLDIVARGEREGPDAGTSRPSNG